MPTATVGSASTWRPSHRMATTDRASLAALEAVVAFTTPSNWRSNSCSSAVSCLVGANVTVPCSAAGMSHSRPWKVSTCGTARRAARMSGWILSMETFSCATRPWLVIASQFSPNCAACWTCWRTLFWASEELLRVAVVVARQPQEPLRTIRRGGRAAERQGARSSVLLDVVPGRSPSQHCRAATLTAGDARQTRVCDFCPNNHACDGRLAVAGLSDHQARQGRLWHRLVELG